MKKLFPLLIFCGLSICAAYSQTQAASTGALAKSVDINGDNKPDVKYYTDGKYVSKIEADTNYDGKPDVVVNLKNGKFQSAEADTDYNGTKEKKFGSLKEFNAWLNKENPEFSDKLNRDDWTLGALEF